MSMLIEAIQPHIARGLLTTRGRAERSLDDLIGHRGAFYPTQIAVPQAWDFDFNTTEKVSEFLAFDCSRFACASFQSYSRVMHDVSGTDRLPWALIQAYYSAFYAGHSILRTIGSACTYVDGSRVGVVRKVLAAYGLTGQFDAGLYSATLHQSGTALRFSRLGGGIGGIHELFWQFFNDRIRTLGEGVLAGPLPRNDAQHVFLALEALRHVFGRSSNASWLSVVRNRIQYQHGMQTWFPGRIVSVADRRTLGRIARAWNGDPLDLPLDASPCGELGTFLSACTFLVATCRSLLARIDERGRQGNLQSFAFYGPIRYLRTQNV